MKLLARQKIFWKAKKYFFWTALMLMHCDPRMHPKRKGEDDWKHCQKAPEPEGKGLGSGSLRWNRNHLRWSSRHSNANCPSYTLDQQTRYRNVDSAYSQLLPFTSKISSSDAHSPWSVWLTVAVKHISLATYENPRRTWVVPLWVHG